MILILIVRSQQSYNFLGIEVSSPSFSSLALMRAFVVCSVKAILSLLVLGSLSILYKNLITSERLQLSKLRSLSSNKVGDILCRAILSLSLLSPTTTLVASRIGGLVCPKVEVWTIPLVSLLGLGVLWVSKVLNAKQHG